MGGGKNAKQFIAEKGGAFNGGSVKFPERFFLMLCIALLTYNTNLRKKKNGI